MTPTLAAEIEALLDRLDAQDDELSSLRRQVQVLIAAIRELASQEQGSDD